MNKKKTARTHIKLVRHQVAIGQVDAAYLVHGEEAEAGEAASEAEQDRVRHAGEQAALARGEWDLFIISA